MTLLFQIRNGQNLLFMLSLTFLYYRKCLCLFKSALKRLVVIPKTKNYKWKWKMLQLILSEVKVIWSFNSIHLMGMTDTGKILWYGWNWDFRVLEFRSVFYFRAHTQEKTCCPTGFLEIYILTIIVKIQLIRIWTFPTLTASSLGVLFHTCSIFVDN